MQDKKRLKAFPTPSQDTFRNDSSKVELNICVPHSRQFDHLHRPQTPDALRGRQCKALQRNAAQSSANQHVQ